MFENIGGKIKTFVGVIFAVEVIACVITGMALVSNNITAPFGLLVMVVGSILAWVSSFFLYGFGELIDYSKKQIQQNEIIIKLLRNSTEIQEQDGGIEVQNNSSGLNVMHIPDKK